MAIANDVLTNRTDKKINYGVTRTDFKFYQNKFFILELNTQPGMTNLSLVPEIANHCGISFSNLVQKILLDASINR